MLNLSRRQEALMSLMAADDPGDLPARRHRWRWRSATNADLIKQRLLLAWMARREVEASDHESPRILRFKARLALERASNGR